MRRPLLVPLLAWLAGCAVAAPPLPPDTTSVNRQRALSESDFDAADLTRDCAAIAAERAENTRRVGDAEAVILANRENNQAAVYFGTAFLFPPALAAARTNDAEKALITSLRVRQDTLIRLAAFKSC